jgi:hypothetical protein
MALIKPILLINSYIEAGEVFIDIPGGTYRCTHKGNLSIFQFTEISSGWLDSSFFILFFIFCLFRSFICFSCFAFSFNIYINGNTVASCILI